MLKLRNIKVAYSGKETLSVERLELGDHELTVVLGHNGSGKSTLMKLLAKQQSPNTGDITLNGLEITRYTSRRFAQEITYLPQHLPMVESMTVRELVSLGRFAHRGTFKRWTKEDRGIIDWAMETVGITAYVSRYLSTLSGGERQRAWIAKLLAQKSKLLLLDEPTSALDLRHQYELMSLLKSLTNQISLVVVLHDVNLMSRFADRVLALNQGKIVFDGPKDDFLHTKSLANLYGINLELMEHPNGRTKIVVVN